ncbi:MAG: ATP-binding protein [Roseofilum sp. SBFL]|uniref:AAA family ATPase n=1 Tax=unclassified Roseofilum TaxID=2620099 RepID=UPI001B0E9A7E|nr:MULTISPECIES: ATP-binding protein [unclassified Roseofilum]MBP0014239.1 ATP-binding protein [Roseofilum sp. SID3]MBP0023772.1 ATP-binding protein [Roseofilum sp. SID2]MBP0038915.1 ATP-binding protein [Roseofilum sp. SID1]MBP0043735.1 ATP-binding protein [Roseofilum sp. SBFL]
MLIEFSVGNYRSFKEPVTFSMVAANLVSKNKPINEDNSFSVDKNLKLLKSSAIYGANASGKSNLVKALGFMKWFIINSSKETQSTEKIKVEPFRLSTETKTQPSLFELVFIMDGTKYRYGFEVTQDKVISEWLYYVPNLRETKLFSRELDNIQQTKKYQNSGLKQFMLIQFTRSNALYLSVCSQFNIDLAEQILDWLSRKLNIVSGLNDTEDMSYTLNCLEKKNINDDIKELIKRLDLGISGIKIKERDFFPEFNILPDDIKEGLRNLMEEDHMKEAKIVSVGTYHQVFDENGNLEFTEEFNLNHHESEGTQKLFALAGRLIMALKESQVLMIDEFDARLHPLISLGIMELFNSKDNNPNNAQLIFITHDTHLLNHKKIRRDQIWFTEKNRYGATDLYSLAEYKVRNDAGFESDYIKGRYGAIPYLGDLSYVMNSND